MKLPHPDDDLAGGVVRLRRWSEADLECVRLAATDENIPKGTTVPAVFTPEEGLAFIERQWGRQANGEGLSLAITRTTTSDNTAIGLIVLLQRAEPSVFGIGYWLIPSARGQGIAHQAVEMLSRWALCDVGVARVEAHVHPGNVASEKTLQFGGFTKEGVLRNFLQSNLEPIDATVFSRIVSDIKELIVSQ